MNERVQPLAIPLTPGDVLVCGDTRVVVGRRVHPGCNRFFAERDSEAVELHLDTFADLTTDIDVVRIEKGHAGGQR